jgi:hypothetical protein
MGLVSVGPVAVAIHVPTFNEGAQPITHGITSFEVSGLMAWATARTLKEMVANPDGRQTVGGQTGVLEYLVFTGDEQEAITGYYLLQSFILGAATYTHRKIGRTPFSLTAAYLGDLPDTVDGGDVGGGGEEIDGGTP